MPAIPRIMSEDFLRKLIDSFYADREKTEIETEATGTVESLPFMLEGFLRFIETRYSVPKVVNDVLFDIYTAVHRYESVDEGVALFAKTLSGDDEVSWKYQRTVRPLLQKYDLTRLESYKPMFTVLYPHRRDDDYEHLILEHRAYSENKLTSASMQTHIIHQLKNNTDPSFRMVGRLQVRGKV